MLNEREKEIIKQVLDSYKQSRKLEKINIENITTNQNSLSLAIYLVHRRQYYPEGLSLTMLKYIEKKLWNFYYQLLGIRHQHDLFYNIENLNQREKEQRISKIANDKRYNNLYFADISKFSKSYFPYAAKVIIKRGYSEVEDVIPELFVWLQDINWPGSYDIFQFLCSIPKDAILKYFEDTVKEAADAKDEGWLYYLQQLMYHFKLTENDFKNKSLFIELNQKIKY